MYDTEQMKWKEVDVYIVFIWFSARRRQSAVLNEKLLPQQERNSPYELPACTVYLSFSCNQYTRNLLGKKLNKFDKSITPESGNACVYSLWKHCTTLVNSFD